MHAWYLVEESVIFSLFGSASTEAKRAIADELRLMPHPEEFRRGKPVLRRRIDGNATVFDLVGPDSWSIFEALSMDYDRLSEPVTTWNMSSSFQEIESVVKTVKVVNDAAERGIKLHSDYVAILVDNPRQRASILQAVEEHWQKFPGFSKAVLAKPK